MAEEGISACIVPDRDPHLSEYLPDHWQTRRWLTGFTGSAGTAVVTRDKALLWTDSRYFIQAARQIASSEFELMKTGEPGVPTYTKWLTDHLPDNAVVGIDQKLFSAETVHNLEKTFSARQIVLNTRTDHVTRLWTDRPALPDSPAWEFPVAFSGMDRKAKIEQLRCSIKESHADFYIVTGLDDIAWIFNLRGADISHSPVNIAFAVIETQKAHLFINKNKLDSSLILRLESDNVQIHDYDDLVLFLSTRQDKKNTALICEKTVNHAIFSAVEKNCRIINAPSVATRLKSVKNEVEIRHLRETMIKDGAAVISFLHWVETCHETGRITEISAGQKIHDFRKQQPEFMEDSFNPIMAFKDHSPVCHYAATAETDYGIKKPGMFLSDTGGHYMSGSTDITRTVYLGDPPDQAIKDYTLVMKGHIALARARFPKGTRGFGLDTLARQAMWRQGINFGHGTGHGVGFFLNIHEGPASISPHPVDSAIKPGMVLTDEPGIYREGRWGIRIENMLLARKDIKTEFGQFLSFETLTLCHYEVALIDKTLMDDDETAWINDYHERVYQTVSPLLDPPVRQWLKTKTRPI